MAGEDALAKRFSNKWINKYVFSARPDYEKEVVSKKELFIIFGLAILLRLCLLLLGGFMAILLCQESKYDLSTLMSYWSRWDSPHYIDIAAKGYANCIENGDHLFLVFLPLYPWMMRLFYFILRDWNLAGLVVTYIAYGIGCCFFYRIIVEEYNKSIANKALILFSFSPFGFFLGAIMTESLFFCLVSASFYFIKKHNWPVVGILGMLCALCRIQGVIILGVAGVEFLETYPIGRYIKGKNIGEFIKAIFTKGIFLLIIPIGNVIYFGINKYVTGNPFQFQIYQKEHWYHETQFFAKTIKEIVSYATSEGTGWNEKICMWYPAFILFMFTLVLLYYGKNRHPLKYTAFLLVYTLINYSVSFLISGGRYMLCAMPIYMIIAEFFERHPKLYPLVVAFSSVLMAAYMIGYFKYLPIY